MKQANVRHTLRGAYADGPLAIDPTLRAVELVANSAGDALKQRRPILCIVDKSGSMSGTPYEAVKRVLLESFSDVVEHAPLLLFDSVCRECTSKSEFASSYASGGTSFCEALTKARAVLETRSKALANVDVLFFTDGEDSFTGELDRACQLFQSQLSKLQGRLHVVGYTRNHSLKVMQMLCGPAEYGNSYQYCVDVEGLRKAFGSVFEHNRVSTVEVLVPGLPEAISVEVGQEPTFFTVPMDLPVSDLNRITLKTNDGSTSGRLKVECVSRPKLREDEVKYLAVALSAIPENASSVERFVKVDGDLTRLMDLLRQNHRPRDIKLCLTDILALKSQIHEIFKRISQSASSNSFDAQANAFAASRSLPTRNRYRNLLHRHIAVNQDKTIQAAKDAVQVAIASGAVHASSDSPLPPDALCEFSLEDADEIAASGSCLCVSVDVTRSEASIAAPSLVYFKEIGGNTFSFDTFRLLATKFASSGAESDYRSVAGELIMKDRHLKPFNAVFPLYVHPGHWAAAEPHLPLACGWIVGLDERVGDESQIAPVVASLAYSLCNLNQRGEDSTKLSEKQIALAKMLWKTLRVIASNPKYAPYFAKQCEKLDALDLNKTAVPNIDGLLGSVALVRCPSDEELPSGFDGLISERTARFIHYECRRRASCGYIRGHDLHMVSKLLLEIHGRFSVGEDGSAKFDPSKLPSFGPRFGSVPCVPPHCVDNEAFAGVLAAWALVNGNENDTTLWTGSYEELDSEPDQVLAKIRNAAEAERDRIELGKIRNLEILEKARVWLQDTSGMAPLPYENHVFNGTLLGVALRLARKFPTRIRDPSDKLRVLTDLGVPLARRNNRAFGIRYE